MIGKNNPKEFGLLAVLVVINKLFNITLHTSYFRCLVIDKDSRINIVTYLVSRKKVIFKFKKSVF